MTDKLNVLRFESRWPAAITIVAVMALLAVLPGRIMLLPLWAPYVIGGVMFVLLVGVELASAKRRWLLIERAVILFFCILMIILNVTNLFRLIEAMLFGSNNFNGLQLFTSSIAMWVINISTFSLLFWQLDRGGPEARINRADRRPYWRFPEDGSAYRDKVWQPQFLDYFYLAYSTATAFGATDIVPINSQAKTLMILESLISLSMIVVVGARAINILGS
jgi:hypothetical protein